MQLDFLQETVPTAKDAAANRPDSQRVKTKAPVQETIDFLDQLQDSLRNRYTEPSPLDITPVPGQVDPAESEKKSLEKNPDALKTISEAADMLDVPQHVLRFWESRFSQIKPLKMAGGRRYYRPQDLEILTTIKHLLYKQGYTIKGAKKAFSLLKKAKTSEIPDNILEQPLADFPVVKQKDFNKKQQTQLADIRAELMGLRETLGALI